MVVDQTRRQASDVYFNRGRYKDERFVDITKPVPQYGLLG